MTQHTEPTPPTRRRVDDPDFVEKLGALVEECGADPDSFDGRLIKDQLLTSLKLITDKRGTGELKLLTAAFKELRYAYSVFDKYPEEHKISIFGSARTKPGHPDYEVTKDFSKKMAEQGWLVITGAGDGIMRAGHEGPGREASFGLSIRLPFETTANEVIAGDSKLINFRYFFTRKLTFVSQSEAVACMPGGFGTMDEIYEALTLIQTGKGALIPVVCLEGQKGDYWQRFLDYVTGCLLDRGMISPDDMNLFYIAADADDAVEHVTRFYRVFHSYRYVRDDLVIRLNRPLNPHDLDRLNRDFAGLIREGRIDACEPYEQESDHLDLPRISFTHTRRDFGTVRRLIDAINDTEPAPARAT